MKPCSDTISLTPRIEIKVYFVVSSVVFIFVFFSPGGWTRKEIALSMQLFSPYLPRRKCVGGARNVELELLSTRVRNVKHVRVSKCGAYCCAEPHHRILAKLSCADH